MHPRSSIAICLHLHGLGHGATEISRRTGVSRPAVRDWISGRLPRSHTRPSCRDCGHPSHARAELPEAYAYLLGIYLGDGCISAQPRGVYRLRIVLDARYPGIVGEVTEAIRTVLPGNAVRSLARTETDASGEEYVSCFEVYSYSRSWPCLFPQHGPGRKHERRIVLTGWQETLVATSPELLLRGLIHSDGCRFTNTGSGGWVCPRYSFSNASDEIRDIFVTACERLGLHTTAAPRTVYISRKADVARMDEFVGPKA